MRRKNLLSSFSVALALGMAACAGADEVITPDPEAIEASEPLPDPGSAAGSRPGDQARELTFEGWIEEGVECPVLRTSDGEIYALSLGEADFGPGDYIRITGELAEASFCMQGKGTLLPIRIDAVRPGKPRHE